MFPQNTLMLKFASLSGKSLILSNGHKLCLPLESSFRSVSTDLMDLDLVLTPNWAMFVYAKTRFTLVDEY